MCSGGGRWWWQRGSQLKEVGRGGLGIGSTGVEEGGENRKNGVGRGRKQCRMVEGEGRGFMCRCVAVPGCGNGIGGGNGMGCGMTRSVECNVVCSTVGRK